MDIKTLKIFSDTAREKSFVKAAHLNFLTQPSVSLKIKQFEEELGFRLLERAPRRVCLTPRGELILPHVDELLLKIESLKSLAEGFKTALLQTSNSKKDLRIASIHSVGIYELTPVLKDFIREHSDISVHLQYRPSRVIYELVASGEVDMGLVAYPHPHPGIKITVFSEDELVLVVPPDHRLASSKSVSLGKINGEKFIAFDDCVPTRSAVDKMLADQKISVVTQVVNENIDTLKCAVEVGLGVSIVPRKTVQEENRKKTLKIVEIRGRAVYRPLAILTLRGSKPSDGTRLFFESLVQNGAHVRSNRKRGRLAKSSNLVNNGAHL